MSAPARYENTSQGFCGCGLGVRVRVRVSVRVSVRVRLKVGVRVRDRVSVAEVGARPVPEHQPGVLWLGLG